MGTPNIIIFSDETGIGVQVGEDKVYLTEEVKRAVIDSYEADARTFRGEMNRLEYENSILKHDLKNQRSEERRKLQKIAEVLELEADEWGCYGT